jgi:hypothetical protein
MPVYVICSKCGFANETQYQVEQKSMIDTSMFEATDQQCRKCDRLFPVSKDGIYWKD